VDKLHNFNLFRKWWRIWRNWKNGSISNPNLS